MKRFSSKFLLAVVALIALGAAIVYFYYRNQQEVSEIGELTESVESLDAALDRTKRNLANSRKGTSLLVRLSSDPETHQDVFAFLQNIKTGAIGCWNHDLPEYPDIRLLSFYDASLNQSGSRRGTHATSMRLLVRTDSLEVIDKLVTVSPTLTSKSNDEPRELHWQLPDGSEVDYAILETGFERLQSTD